MNKLLIIKVEKVIKIAHTDSPPLSVSSHDPNHVINWDVIQVEPEGEFRIEPMRILDRKVTMLRNRAIG